MKIPFIKYHGAGNDFILMDLRQANPLIDPAACARLLCERRTGIGADGLLLLLPSSVADYRMRIFNADGSEAAMCGNGIRCIVDFIADPVAITIETLHGILSCRRTNSQIAVNLGSPKVIHWPLELQEGPAYVVNTGVPHAVLFVSDLRTTDVDSLGRKIRSDPRFAPHGVNVNFASKDAQGKIALRTYERGVEAETLACGTGAAATALAALSHFKLSSPISILTRCSFHSTAYHEQLQFLFPTSPSGNLRIEMLGTAHQVFTGIIDLREGEKI